MPQTPPFAHLASVMRRETPPDDAAATALALFGYGPPDSEDTQGSAGERDVARLFDLAAGFSRFFRLSAAEAPGLFVFGAEVDPARIAPWWTGKPVGVSGAALTRRHAFEACVGEAAEFLSGLESPLDRPRMIRCPLRAAGVDDPTARLVSELLATMDLDASTELDWLRANRLSDGAETLVPADLCLRRDPAHRLLTPPGPLSIGCAAAPDPEAAVRHALLELVERDAAALWWRGGRRGRLVPLEADAGGLLNRMRHDRRGRRSWLLDITGDLGIPCAAAVSFAPDGHGFCAGTAARPHPASAHEAALREMGQMELAHELAQYKRQAGGEAALNEIDLRHARRFTGIDQAGCALVHPLPPGIDPDPDLPPGGLRALTDRLVVAGLQPRAIDLTRAEIGIPAVRVICPGLEQEPSDLSGHRLRAAIEATGGGARHSRGIPLM